ncbi:MAG: hypothetical protein ACRYFS_19835 [Janthinobacterium lividum]
MDLTSRPAAHEDFAHFFDACYHAACADQVLRQVVEHEWHVLLDSPASLSLVVEDLERPTDSRLIGCAQLVFVKGSFVRLTRELPEPWVNARLAPAVLCSPSPLMTVAQIARANATLGLHAVFTRWHRADWHLSNAEMLEAGIFMHAAFQHYACGYRFREILVEATGERARDLALRAGFHLRCDYADYYGSHPPVPPPVWHPFLMGITHAEATAADSSMMGHYFVHRPPKLGLTPSQQALLELCLRQPDLSDAALAATMGVPVHRVKNLLRAAYGRISDVAFELLPETGNGQRGPEKKRQLISFLRDHPEELRPYQR